MSPHQYTISDLNPRLSPARGIGMARTATKERNGRNAYGDDSIAGYFRKVFQENPKLLKGRSNDKLLERWLEDHQAYKEVPSDVKSSLANIKSVLRHKKRKRKKDKMDL